jgi:hypothetical protein
MNMEFGGFPDGGKITGVCLNVGDSAIDFPHESYGETLAKCLRYYYKIGGSGDWETSMGGEYRSTTSARAYVKHRTVMRATPSISISSFSGNILLQNGTNANKTVTSFSMGHSNNRSAALDLNISGTASVTNSYTQVFVNHLSGINFDAEL